MIPEFYRKKYLTEQPFHTITNVCADFIVKGVLTVEDLRIMVDIAKEKAASSILKCEHLCPIERRDKT